jgi:hypothetical protein
MFSLSNQDAEQGCRRCEKRGSPGKIALDMPELTSATAPPGLESAVRHEASGWTVGHGGDQTGVGPFRAEGMTRAIRPEVLTAVRTCPGAERNPGPAQRVGVNL